jgi:hypothetical protein
VGASAAGGLADVPEQNLGVPIAPGYYIGLRFRPFGRALVDGYLAGPVAAQLASEGERATIGAWLTGIAAAQAAARAIGAVVSRC